MELFNFEDLAAIVDDLADVKAQLSELKATEENLRAALIASEVSAANGTLHRATITSTTRTLTDWQAIAHALGATDELIAAHTTQTAPTFTVRLTARKA
jgi:hypothetical protein